MIRWSEQHELVRAAVRRFIEAEIAPNLEAIEHGDAPPYDVLRKLVRALGMDELARARFERQIARERSAASGAIAAEPPGAERPAGPGRGDSAALQIIPIIELSRYCPGLVTALGVSMGLTAAAVMSRGSLEQKLRWGLDLLTLNKIGAWAITEPGSGSDAFGSMRSTARLQRDGSYALEGSKTFITNGPYADLIVFICKVEEDGADRKDWKVASFVLEKGMDGLTQSGPLRKMGLHSSPTGELFLRGVVAGPDRLLGGAARSRHESGARDSFAMERSTVAAMALGIVERCLELSLAYARQRVQFGQPIGEFQLIQEKLARMEVARLNLQNLVFRAIESAAEGSALAYAEASAMKLYAARAAVEVALEAVQIHGGNGYMAEYRVEQLARDAKVLQIYGGTDEIQISAIARDLLAR